MMLFGVKTTAQTTNTGTTNKTLEAIAKTCDSLMENFNHSRLEKLVDSTIKIIPPSNYKYLYQFYTYKGEACELSDAAGTVCIEIYKKALGYAQKANQLPLALDAMGQMIGMYSSNDTKQAAERDSIISVVRQISDTAQNDQIKIGVANVLKIYHYNLGDHGKALQYALDVLALQKKLLKNGIATKMDLANALHFVTEIYEYMGEQEKQLQYMQELRTYITEAPDYLSAYYLTYAKIIFHDKKVGEATLYYDSLTVLAKKYNNSSFWNRRLNADLYFTQGFVKWGEIDNASIYANRANELKKTWAYDYYEAQINYVNGIVQQAKKNYPLALTFLKTAMPLSYKYHYNDIYMLCIKKISECYAAMGDWQNAYSYSTRLNVAQDSLAAINSEAVFAEAEEKYQNKEKQLQITAKNMQLAAARKQQLWLMAGLALAGLTATLLVIIYRNKKRTADVMDKQNKILGKLNNDLEEANQTKAKLFGIISHDLRSPISQVYQFLKLQQMAPDRLDEAQRLKLSNKIQSATGSLLETMEDLLLWSKTQMNQFNTDIQPVDINLVVSECLQLLQLNSEDKSLKIENNIPPGTIVNSDPYFQQTILRNLLQNAIRVSPQEGLVKIDFSDKKLTIQNSGAHFSQQQYQQTLVSAEGEKSLSGLGLRVVDELSRKINATVFFAATGNDTTCVQITFA